MLNGTTAKVITGDGTICVIINYDDSNTNIAEVIINPGKSGSTFRAECEALGRMITYGLWLGGDPEYIASQLRGIIGYNPRIGSEAGGFAGEKIYSIPDAVGKVLLAEIVSERKKKEEFAAEKERKKAVEAERKKQKKDIEDQNLPLKL